VEYADFQCSHCYNSYLTTDGPLFENYINTGKVLLEYRPLNFLGPESQLSAEAAYCAADQGVFWQYRDVLYANYSTNNTGGYSESRLMDFASSLNMDIDAFSQCLSSGEKAAAIDQNVEAAVADEVSGTPSFLINGTLYPGEQPYSNLQAVIESILSGAN
jgi:protein-disulfide isomerase